MSFSRLSSEDSQARDSNESKANNTTLKDQFFSVLNYFKIKITAAISKIPLNKSLGVAKVITSSAQTVFGTQAWMQLALDDKNNSNPINLAVSAVGGSNSLIYTYFSRFQEMKNHSRAEEKLPDIQLTLSQESIKMLAITLSYFSRFFTAVAGYNGTFNLIETIYAAIYSKEKSDNILSDDQTAEALAQLFAGISFAAQLLSFAVFQSKRLDKALYQWWFNESVRLESFGIPTNVGVFIYSSLLLASNAFFGYYSTEAGLNNFNKSFCKSLSGFELPKELIDGLSYFSAGCVTSLTFFTAIPAIYQYIDKKERISKPLSKKGKLVRALGQLDTGFYALAAARSCTEKLSNFLDIEERNLYFLLLVGGLSMVSNVPYTYLFNVRPTLQDLYRKLQLDILADDEHQERLLEEKDSEQNTPESPEIVWIDEEKEKHYSEFRRRSSKDMLSSSISVSYTEMMSPRPSRINSPSPRFSFN